MKRKSEFRKQVEVMFPDDTPFDIAARQVMADLDSGKLYQEQLDAIKATGLDPEKPIELGFRDGSKATFRPIDGFQHLNPPIKKGKRKR